MPSGGSAAKADASSSSGSTRSCAAACTEQVGGRGLSRRERGGGDTGQGVSSAPPPPYRHRHAADLLQHVGERVDAEHAVLSARSQRQRLREVAGAAADVDNAQAGLRWQRGPGDVCGGGRRSSRVQRHWRHAAIPAAVDPRQQPPHLVGEAKVAQQVGHHPVAVLDRAVEERLLVLGGDGAAVVAAVVAGALASGGCGVHRNIDVHCGLNAACSRRKRRRVIPDFAGDGSLVVVRRQSNI